MHLRLRPVDGACVVQGDYAYYHYLQQGEEDKGWGCAYRSLQTLFSFFTCSHYVECPVPSIAEVRKRWFCYSRSRRRSFTWETSRPPSSAHASGSAVRR